MEGGKGKLELSGQVVDLLLQVLNNLYVLIVLLLPLLLPLLLVALELPLQLLYLQCKCLPIFRELAQLRLELLPVKALLT